MKGNFMEEFLGQWNSICETLEIGWNFHIQGTKKEDMVRTEKQGGNNKDGKEGGDMTESPTINIQKFEHYCNRSRN